MRTPPFCLAPAMVLLVGLAFAAAPPRPRTDAYGDPLPPAALARLGTARFRCGGSAFLSPDGKILAVPDREAIRLLDADTGKERRRIAVPNCLLGKFSPEGKFLAVCFHSKAVVFDLGTGVMLSELAFGEPVRASFLSLSRNGKLLAVGAWSARRMSAVILLWDVKARKMLRSVAVSREWGVALTLSPDGKVLATWDRSSPRQEPPILQLWDTVSSKELRTLKLNARRIECALFSPDGKHLLAATNESILNIYDVATGARLTRFAGRRGVGAVLRYSSDGKQIAAGSRDGVVQLWDSATGKRLGLCESPPGIRLNSIAFLPDNKVLAAGVSGLTARIWEVPSGRERTPRGGHLSAVTTLAFSRDGKMLLSGGADGVRLWQTTTGKEGRHIQARRDDGPRGAGVPVYQLSPDGRHLLWGVWRDLGLRVINVSSGKEIAELDASSDNVLEYSKDSQSMDACLPAAFALDGNAIATLHVKYNPRECSLVRFWDLATGQQKRTIEVGGPVERGFLALSPDGKVLAVLGHHSDHVRRLTIWNATNGKPIATQTVLGEYITAMFSPDGVRLATASDDSKVVLLDAADGSEVGVLRGAKDHYPHAFAFSPDGRALAVASDGEKGGAVRLWELASGKVRATFAAPGSLALAFSPDGRSLASSGSDTTVTLWDATGSAVRRKEKLKPAELSALWADLDSTDAAKAHRAMARLTAAPVETLVLLKKELKPAAGKPLTEKEVKRLIGDLAGESFEGREKVAKALKAGGRFLRPALLTAFHTSADLEQKRRLGELLKGLAASMPGPEMVRPTRALEVLERLGTPEATRFLETLVKGNPGARLTEDAASTLKRMAKTP